MSEPRAEAAEVAFAEAGGRLDDRSRPLVRALGAAAPALVPLITGDPSIPEAVLAEDLEAPLEFDRLTASLCPEGVLDEAVVRHRLRRGRHVHLVRLALREALSLADVDTTAREMSDLASACTELALACAAAQITGQRGTPTIAGRAAARVCLGMGKLGGGELNLGSDVDLCFFYESDETDEAPGQRHTTHEIESAIATRASKILADVDEHGFVFRVDLRLRPEGARGPVANSLASAERYYEAFGRAWERAVLLRARPIAGDRALGAALLGMVRPFVFPRRVDPRIAAQMAQMLERTRTELAVDDERDVKLGSGGIREAEFFVQTLQLVWGGRHPELQVAGTLPALRRLVGLGLVTDREARALEESWALLRRVEHRIHVWAGYQSHCLPDGPELDPFARSLGIPDADALRAALTAARQTVAQLFRSLLDETARGVSEASVLAERLAVGDADDAALLRTFGDVDPDEARVHLARLARHADDPLGPRARERHPELAARLLEAIAESADPGRALRFTADFFARLRGWDYPRLLDERGALRRFISLFGASDALAAALVGHPEDLDVLLGGLTPDATEIAALHAAMVLEPLPNAEDFVAAARTLKRQVTLRLGLGWTSGEIELGEALERLSALAREQLVLALRFAQEELEARFGRARREDGGEASMVVVALGKLGSAELGWGSDLDLVFLYDHDGETTGPRRIDARDFFTRIAQRTLRLLSQPDAEGPGYETDTRLRPSGAQGTLVSSLAAFERYHEAGAQDWERLAWMRARPIAGPPDACDAVRAALASVAFGGPLPDPKELARMRGRMRSELAHEGAGVVHPKLGAGSLADIEFLSQWMLLRCGRSPRSEGRDLLGRATSEALDLLLGRGVLTPAEHAALAEGARFLRAVEQSLRLVDEGGDGRLFLRSRVAERVARRVGVRARAGRSASEVLAEQIHRHRERIRGIFDHLVAPVPENPTPRPA